MKLVNLDPFNHKKFLINIKIYVERYMLFVIIVFTFLLVVFIIQRGFSNKDLISLLNYRGSTINSRSGICIRYKIKNYNDLVVLNDNLDNNFFEAEYIKRINFKNTPNYFRHMQSETEEKTRRDLFVKMVLPFIVKNNLVIKKDQEILEKISDKITRSDFTGNDLASLRTLANKYGVKDDQTDFWSYLALTNALLLKIQTLPNSLVLGILAKETSWGSFDEDSYKPSILINHQEDAISIKRVFTNKIEESNTLEDVVDTLFKNLNSNNDYSEFRNERWAMLEMNVVNIGKLLKTIENSGKINDASGILKLINQNHLDSYNKYEAFKSGDPKLCVRFIN